MLTLTVKEEEENLKCRNLLRFFHPITSLSPFGYIIFSVRLLILRERRYMKF